jgi:arylsulfatase A-like enzyme
LFRDGGKYLVANDSLLAPNPKYLTDIFGDETIRLIDKYSEDKNPFFINLWLKTPHTPYEPAPEPHYSKYKELNYPEREGQNFHRGHNQPGDGILYNSMVSHMDEVIGRIINRLKELNLYENTIIVFTSDNGPSFRGFPDPWKGGKADLHEGGIRVPMIAYWAKHFPAGKTYSEMLHSNDIFPTFCDAAGVSAEKYKVDGISMIENLETLKPYDGERTLFWQLDLAVDPWNNVWYPQPGAKPQPYSTAVVRKGEWKLLADSLKPVILYNMLVDSLESKNLIEQHPEKVNEMVAELETFFKEERMQRRGRVRPK